MLESLFCIQVFTGHVVLFQVYMWRHVRGVPLLTTRSSATRGKSCWCWQARIRRRCTPTEAGVIMIRPGISGFRKCFLSQRQDKRFLTNKNFSRMHFVEALLHMRLTKVVFESTCMILYFKAGRVCNDRFLCICQATDQPGVNSDVCEVECGDV